MCLAHGVSPYTCTTQYLVKTSGNPVKTYTVLFLHTFFLLDNLSHKSQLPQPPQILIYICLFISMGLPGSPRNLLSLLQSRKPEKSEGSPHLYIFSQETKFCMPAVQYLKTVVSYILSSPSQAIMTSVKSDLAFIKITFTESFILYQISF